MKRVVVLAAFAGCSFKPGAGSSDASPDSNDATIDSAPSALHLLLSEIETDNGEMIEIYNPTDTPIELQNYYLSDHNEYWRLPEHGQTPITLDASDFLVRFPADAPALPPGGVAVVAINGIAFRATYGGQSPDYTILVAAGTAKPMNPVVAQNTPSLTNTGEMVVLFYWDGASDLVRDVDLVVVGSTVPPANAPVAKLMVDGPDADTMPTAYAAEALDLGELGDTAADRTHKRTQRERDREVHGAGNGITGDDETSEEIQLTWDMRQSAGTPGAVPTSLQMP